MRIRSFLFAAFVFTGVILSAQDFGFGGEEDAGTSANSGDFAGTGSHSVSISGEVSASLLGYVDDFHDGAGSVRFGDIFSGKLNFKAGVSNADAVINFRLVPATSPIAIDEAYLRIYAGDFDIEGGLRKLTWGKADRAGPLDVINPLDYSDLSLFIDNLNDAMTLKIARPLVHISWNIGSFSKLEGVFVPYYEGYRFDESGRWTPAQIENLATQLSNFPAGLVTENEADITTLDYAQAGLRFTTTIGSSDFGIQYYYGRLPMPSLSFSFTPTGPVPSALNTDYNRYHQIGLDYARVISGFNIRAEFAANLTDDLSGDDGAVYNPHLAWSLGFDRDLFWGVNLNLQAVETIVLLHNKIDGNPMIDIEAGSDITSTRITAKLAKTFFRDELEIAVAALWGIEDMDCFVMPVLSWTKGDVTTELSGGIFAGSEDGQFGHYHKNNFVRVRIKYAF
jgi:hypothetical protein